MPKFALVLSSIWGVYLRCAKMKNHKSDDASCHILNVIISTRWLLPVYLLHEICYSNCWIQTDYKFLEWASQHMLNQSKNKSYKMRELPLLSTLTLRYIIKEVQNTLFIFLNLINNRWVGRHSAYALCLFPPWKDCTILMY
jgi:hypothetical protein